MKGAYVAAMRRLRSLLTVVGVVPLLDRLARRSRTALWVRSWLSVYDLDDLLALDVPWWTFESSDLVADLLHRRAGARVFEWGSGASTVWLGARSAAVTSVEHDAAWAAHMHDVLPANAELLLVEPEPVGAHPGADVVRSQKAGFDGLDFRAYVDAIDATSGDFDVIVIDGRAREACLDKAVHRLAAHGLIVFDNVDRARYRDAIAGVAQHTHLAVTWTRGRTPALPYPTRTALIGVRRP